jgi:hypothetical protein
MSQHTWTEQEARETATRMIERYKSPGRAMEAATDHALDYPQGHTFRAYWETVRALIQQGGAR